MMWLTPARVRVDGVETAEPPGGCIVFRPDDPQWFGGDMFTPFGNHWFHFHGPESQRLLDTCGIPPNRVLRLRDDRFVEPLLNLFLRESMNRGHLWQHLLYSHLWRFFVEMSRSLAPSTRRPLSTRGSGRRGEFENLRALLKARCGSPWTVQDMADATHLSPSRFTRLYREFFDMNPVDDLIRMRIARAEYYLGMTDMPVGEIATSCGFSDVHYFSRQFKSKTGDTPANYRLMQQR